MVFSYNIYDARKFYLFTASTEQMRYPYNELAASGLPIPTRLEGWGYALSRLKTATRSPR